MKTIKFLTVLVALSLSFAALASAETPQTAEDKAFEAQNDAIRARIMKKHGDLKMASGCSAEERNICPQGKYNWVMFQDGYLVHEVWSHNQWAYPESERALLLPGAKEDAMTVSYLKTVADHGGVVDLDTCTSKDRQICPNGQYDHIICRDGYVIRRLLRPDGQWIYINVH